MYLRPVHTSLDTPALHAFIHSNPLGVLTTAIKSPDFPTIQSSHIPWVLSPPSSTNPSSLAKLRGHIARANPQAKALIAAANSQGALPTGTVLDDEVMVLFTSPTNHYITPNFYVETKPATGKVVPTWNYAAVQCYGKITVHSSTSGAGFLKEQLRDLSALCEQGQMGYGDEEAWKVEEAPESYVGLLSKAIVGVEIEVERIAGKWKMSQELGEGDREGVIRGFEALGTERGADIARVVAERAALKEGKQTG
jgi:transcriptional regulator